MAFKRKDIRAILEDESLSVEERTARLVGLHMETVDALNDQIASLKGDADKLKDAQTELSDLKAKQDESGKWEEKYKTEHAEFTAFKKAQESAATKEAKTKAYKSILKDAGISESLIDLVTAASGELIDSIELDEKQTAKDAAKLKSTVREKYADYVSKEDTSGADTQVPPNNSGKKLTKEEIFKIKDSSARQKAIAENHEIFGF